MDYQYNFRKVLCENLYARGIDMCVHFLAHTLLLRAHAYVQRSLPKMFWLSPALLLA